RANDADRRERASRDLSVRAVRGAPRLADDAQQRARRRRRVGDAQLAGTGHHQRPRRVAPVVARVLQMPNRYAWIALGLGAYIAFTLSSFPATAAYRWFAPETLRMAGIEGTVWSGRAAL